LRYGRGGRARRSASPTPDRKSAGISAPA
jgi:hypothetical protein